MAHITFDVCKLTYLVGKGIIRKLIQVKNCIIALQEKDIEQNIPDATTVAAPATFATLLERSFHEVDTCAIEAELDTVDVEDGWVLVLRRSSD